MVKKLWKNTQLPPALSPLNSISVSKLRKHSVLCERVRVCVSILAAHEDLNDGCRLPFVSREPPGAVQHVCVMESVM